VSADRPSTAGKTRACPHCRATILESANVCPICKHHLRFDPKRQESSLPSFSALKVEGTIHHNEGAEPWEYSMMLSIRNERGEEVARQLVGVGALGPRERRTFSLSVEVFTPDAKVAAARKNGS
jgi:uncharacterized protein YbaR (Trm112 family)